MAQDTNPSTSSQRVAFNSFTANRVAGQSVTSPPREVFRQAQLNSNTEVVTEIPDDWRIRISLPPGNDLFYKEPNPGILEPLRQSLGVIFPYTPAITVTNEAQYDLAQSTHSNYGNFFYKGSQTQAISIAGDFTVQNSDEGRYLLAAVFFFRAATKMFFGGSSNAGNPPIIVTLNGYGQHYFRDVPCVVTSFAHTLPADVDYMPIKQPLITSYTRVPTNSQLTVVLQPVYSRSQLYNNYNLGAIANGSRLAGFI